MDVTPQLIEQIDFSEKFRGYDPDQVDDFLERVGGTLSELQSQMAELAERADRAETEARSLREKPTATAPPDDDAAIDQVSRTLLLANRTAEAAVAEARQEAAALLVEARSQAEANARDAGNEAERLVREAHTQREELLRRARDEADHEFARHRERFAEEIRGLEARRNELTEDVRVLEERLGDYRDDLERVHTALRTILDDPSSLRAAPPLNLDPAGPPASPSAFYSTGTVDAVSGGDPQSVSSPAAPPAAQQGGPQAAHAVAHPPAAGESGGEYVAPSDVSVVGDTAAVSASTVSASTGDRWGPGSWSEVAPSLATDPSGPSTLFEAPHRPASAGATVAVAPAPDPAMPAPTTSSPFDEDQQVFEPRSSGAESVVPQPLGADQAAYRPPESVTVTGSHERYLRHLDEAVNGDDAESDRAMRQFFEGDGEPAKGRFGRRR